MYKALSRDLQNFLYDIVHYMYALKQASILPALPHYALNPFVSVFRGATGQKTSQLLRDAPSPSSLSHMLGTCVKGKKIITERPASRMSINSGDAQLG